MRRFESGRFRWILVCLAVSSPFAAAAQTGGVNQAPAFTFTPPPCEGNVFLDVNCSGQFDAWIEQYARDAITGGCGGGNYCTNDPVNRGQMAVFVEKAMRGSSKWPPNTVLVQAVLNADGSQNPTASGQALLAAVAAIPSSGPGAPGIANPWLVRLGPGTFHLGAQPLVLPNHIVLEGAGSGNELPSPSLTRILSQGFATGTGTIVMPSSAAALRDLFVSNSGGAAYAIAVHSPGSAKLVLQRVYLDADGGTTETAGLRTSAPGSFVWITDSIVHAAGTSKTDGIILEQSGSTVRLERSRVILGGAGPESTGISVDGNVELSDSKITVVSLVPDIHTVGVGATDGTITRSVISADCSGTGSAEGLSTTGAVVALGESSVTASPSSCESYAVVNNADSFTVVGSFLGGKHALQTNSGSSVTVHRSTLSGSTDAIANPPGSTFRVGASQVAGPIVNGGTLTCVASYDGSFSPLTCP